MTGPGAVRPYRVLVVDDEPLARDALRGALEDHPDFEIAGEAVDGAEAVDAIGQEHYDLVLLDIRMPGLDGFDVVREVGAAAMPAVVFVTAYDEFAVDAFDVHALDYLVKPFDDDRFAEMLDHVRRRLRVGGSADLEERLRALLESEGREGSEPGRAISRLMVREDERIHFVEVDDIDYLEADGNHVILHTRAGTHRIRASLKGLEDRLDDSTWVRIHRSTILNLDRLAEVRPWLSGDYVAVLDDGRQLRVSRHYRPRLLRDAF